MERENLADLVAFITVAREGSFTRAARRLGMSQSGVSQVVRRLEDRLELRLLDRTTRSVAPTRAGAHLQAQVEPLLKSVELELTGLSQFRDRIAGVIRVTAVEHAAQTILLPAAASLVQAHPEIEVEIVVDYHLTDIVAEGFDAGVRLGEHVAKDMIAARLSPPIQMAVVAAPAYLERYPAPTTPGELVNHRCINLRLPGSGALNRWRFVEQGREARVHVEGPLVLDRLDLIRDAALAGVGLAYLPWDQVAAMVQAGRLVSLLADCLPPLPGYFLYYAHRRNASPAFRLFVEAVRYRAG